MPFTLLAYGPWLPSQVHLTRVPNSRPLLPDVERLIEATWSAGLARTPKLFDGPMCRLESLDPAPAALRVAISPSSYKPFYGTNLSHPHLADAHGRGVLANPVGLSPALLTADGHLVFGRRNASVAYYPNRTHPFAGALEPADPDLFAGLRRELHEELHLTPADLRDELLLGVVEDPALRQPEFIFHVTTTKTLHDLKRDLDPDEHHAVVAILADHLRSADPHVIADLTPVASATVDLYLRLRHSGPAT